MYFDNFGFPHLLSYHHRESVKYWMFSFFAMPSKCRGEYRSVRKNLFINIGKRIASFIDNLDKYSEK